ncbi:MAG: hypothetical protein V4623_04995 [Pseudomonadota bacterium]
MLSSCSWPPVVASSIVGSALVDGLNVGIGVTDGVLELLFAMECEGVHEGVCDAGSEGEFVGDVDVEGVDDADAEGVDDAGSVEGDVVCEGEAGAGDAACEGEPDPLADDCGVFEGEGVEEVRASF